MAVTIIVHLVGEEAFLAELEDMPSTSQNYVIMRNIRKKDGKEVTYLTDGAKAFLVPWTRISFLEVMSEMPDQVAAVSTNGAQGTTILGFFREEEKRS
ncbi:MAG: hypothetical protein M3R06_09205 [Chloroflexota bacterium]|nr:hypothetical protein [Chloroflexota bacterium]